MHAHPLGVASLTSLFAALLSGCSDSTPKCSDPLMQTVELTPEDYEYWQKHGLSPDDPTMAEGADGADSSGGTGGSTSGADTTGGGLMLTDDEVCKGVCDYNFQHSTLDCKFGEPDAKGNIPIDCTYFQTCLGRRHLCVESSGEVQGGARVGAWLARDAHNEAASVHAFAALGRELAAHGAPAALLARIAAAMREEERHAALVGALARARGADVVRPVIADVPARDLLAIAVENAVEGCVGETWAALVNAHQARAAADPRLREVYAEIAADEAGHAELAWALHAWLMGQLDEDARATVTAARAAAVRRWITAAEDGADDPAALALGVPDQARALRLLTGLDAELWSRAA